MARSWLRVSEFDKFRDNRRGRNSPLEADNAAHTTTPRPRQVVFVAFASKGYRGRGRLEPRLREPGIGNLHGREEQTGAAI